MWQSHCHLLSSNLLIVQKVRLKILMDSFGTAVSKSCFNTIETHCEGDRRCLTGCGQSRIVNGETLMEKKHLNGMHIRVFVVKSKTQSILTSFKYYWFHVLEFILQIVLTQKLHSY